MISLLPGRCGVLLVAIVRSSLRGEDRGLQLRLMTITRMTIKRQVKTWAGWNDLPTAGHPPLKAQQRQVIAHDADMPLSTVDHRHRHRWLLAIFHYFEN